LVALLRRLAYDVPRRRPNDRVQPTVDPAIKTAHAARARRDTARTLVPEDPLPDNDLHIGRPDLVLQP